MMRMVMLAVMCVVVLGAVGGESKRVAIVGAGIGGSSLAHFLSEADDSLELHVFERRQVGGRMANVEERMDALVREGKEKGGEEGEKKVVVELGGTIYHRVNSLVAALLKKTGLEGHHADDGLDTDTFGIWKGDSFGFQSVSLPALPWFEKALNIFQMVTRYGPFTLWKFDELLRTTVDSYLGIYSTVETGNQSFRTPLEFLRAMDSSGAMERLVNESLCDFLEQRHGLSEAYVREFASAVTRVQYTQDCAINALVGLVALLPVVDDDCYRIQGGNMHLPERLISLSRASLRQATVTQVASDSSAEGYLLRFRSYSGDHAVPVEEEESFDVVVLASPLELSGVQFGGDLAGLNGLPRRGYQTVHVTMVSGQVNPLYFSSPSVPQCILTTERDDVIPFTALCSNTMLDLEDPDWRLYKIFSKAPLNDALLDSLFTSRRYHLHRVIQAYPQLPPMLALMETLPFELADSLYYVNAMETIFSTMETEAISALNIRNLIMQSLKNQR